MSSQGLVESRQGVTDTSATEMLAPPVLRPHPSPQRPKVLHLDLRSPVAHPRASSSPQRPQFLNLDRSTTSWSTSSASLSSWSTGFSREQRRSTSPDQLSTLTRELEQQRLLCAQFEHAAAMASAGLYHMPEPPQFCQNANHTPMLLRYQTVPDASGPRRLDILAHQLQMLENQRLELSQELRKLQEKPTDQEEVLDRLLTRFTLLRLQADDLARRTSDTIDLRVSYPSTDSLEESFMGRSRITDTSNSFDIPMASTDDVVGGLLSVPCRDNSWHSSDTPPSTSTDSGLRNSEYERPFSEHVPGWLQRQHMSERQSTPTKSLRANSACSSLVRPLSSDAYSSSLPEEEEELANGDDVEETANLEDNLREEIVARGHPVTLYREEVYLTTEACRGYLIKMGGRVKTWRRRWFVFDRHREQLMYFLDPTETKNRGFVDFSTILDVYVNNNPPRRFRSPNRRLTFCLDTTSRTYYFVADSSEVMRMWIDVLLTAVKSSGARYRL